MALTKKPRAWLSSRSSRPCPSGSRDPTSSHGLIRNRHRPPERPPLSTTARCREAWREAGRAKFDQHGRWSVWGREVATPDASSWVRAHLQTARRRHCPLGWCPCRARLDRSLRPQLLPSRCRIWMQARYRVALVDLYLTNQTGSMSGATRRHPFYTDRFGDRVVRNLGRRAGLGILSTSLPEGIVVG